MKLTFALGIAVLSVNAFAEPGLQQRITTIVDECVKPSAAGRCDYYGNYSRIGAGNAVSAVGSGSLGAVQQAVMFFRQNSVGAADALWLTYSDDMETAKAGNFEAVDAASDVYLKEYLEGGQPRAGTAALTVYKNLRRVLRKKARDEKLKNCQIACLSTCVSSRLITGKVDFGEQILNSGIDAIKSGSGSCQHFSEIAKDLMSYLDPSLKATVATGFVRQPGTGKASMESHALIDVQVSGKHYQIEPQSAACQFFNPEVNASTNGKMDKESTVTDHLEGT